MRYSSEEIQRLRAQWQYTGQKRPSFALKPNSTQESVWDYPRPPCIEQSDKMVKVLANQDLVAISKRTIRILETSSPPVYYIPLEDINSKLLVASDTTSFCEWKGEARYYSLKTDLHLIKDAAWYYPKPLRGYSTIKQYLAFYPSKVLCFIDGVLVQPQKDSYYGGWITPEIVGPFKDEVDVS